MGDYGYAINILIWLGIILAAWSWRWHLGWREFGRHPTTVQDCWIDYLAWVVPVAGFVWSMAQALAALGFDGTVVAVVWVVYGAFAGIRTYYAVADTLGITGVIATAEEMVVEVSIDEVLAGKE